ncbi:MAG: hypothetical protein H6Q07_340 [Acidobacteria bacterium]|jgi:uncharacterized membrane protein|nr:hypothetical protein [Acidobacteriota bacterium]
MEDLSKVISAGTGPIIVISACGLLCLAYYNRLSGMVARLRLFHRERLKEKEELERLRAIAQPDPAALTMHEEMLQTLEAQTTEIMHRARLIRRSLSCFLLTIACLSICSLLVGISVLWPGLIIASVLLFISGMALLVVGVIIAMRELHHALQPVELESRFIAEIASAIEKISE